MSPTILAAQRRRSCLLASTFLAPVLSLGISAANAQQPPSANHLPPIEISSPGDQNRTRAKPVPMKGPARAAPRRASRPANANVAPAARLDAPATARRQSSNSPASSAIATPVITADDIAHSPALTVQEIIAQAPGVQLTSPVWRRQRRQDQRRPARIRRLRHLQHARSCINGRRLNDIDMAGVDFSTIPRDSIERIEIIQRQQRRGAVRRQRDRRRHQHRH